MLSRSLLLLRPLASSAKKPSARSFMAALCSEVGKVEVREMKAQTPHESQILVEVESSGFNPADAQMIAGHYHIRQKLPFTPGFEIAGNVKAVGKKVSKWKEGDRVLVIRSAGNGGFAEECIVDTQTDLIIALPYSIDYETAAAITTSYATAYLALKKMAADKQGSQVLVLSSRGMIAFAAIDLAQNIFKASGIKATVEDPDPRMGNGSRVFAASDDEEKLEKLRATGIQSTINYQKEDLVRKMRKASFGHGVDAVVDTVGGDIFQQTLQCVRPGGNIFSLGFTSGKIPEVSLLDLHRTQASISGIWLGGRRIEEQEEVVKMLLDLFEQNYLTCRIEAKYPLKDIQTCVDDINANKLFGKVLINPKD